MLLGMIISFLGYFVFLPWGSDYPSIQIACKSRTFRIINKSYIFLFQAYTTPVTTHPTTVLSSSVPTSTSGDSDGQGCPFQYNWCYSIPRVQLWQYILASVVITTGFSICNVICYSIFSKKLGDRPQGTMMGIFTSAGSLARAFGPISVGFIYKHWGPRIMMIFMLVFVLTGILSLIFNYKRLYIDIEPPDDFDDDEEAIITSNGNDGLDSINDIAE
jgi:ceroid-lipofuscinosis MFS transporter 7